MGYKYAWHFLALANRAWAERIGVVGKCSDTMHSILSASVKRRVGLGKPTEMTIWDLLQKELKRKGVVVVPEISYKSLDGRRLTFDLVLKNGAQFTVESRPS